MRISRSLWIAILSLGLTLCVACNKADSTSALASSGSGKIPITTNSEDARKEFLQGRELAEKLLAQDSLQHFDRAIALDPEFASAELARANASATAKDFFDHQKKAVTLAGKVSEPEKLLILASEAGANGDVTKQKDYLEQLVAACPNDERAHFNLGGYYFGQQEYGPAIEQYKKATEIAPDYSPAYNILGYALRQQDDFTQAEQAFKKYIELIPSDPNPYDSYAELLLKMGRYDDSIAQYRKALSIDPHFVPSHFGISADLMYLGKPGEAEEELKTMSQEARNDGELRTALFGLAVVASDTGKMDKAVEQIDREYAVAEKKNDLASMAADLQAKGNILTAATKYEDAQKQFDRSLQLVESSSLSTEIKQNAELLHHFNLAAIAIEKRDFAAAESQSRDFQQGAEASRNPVQMKQTHELAGRLALARKDYDKAITELEQANLQNPPNLYRLAECYQAKGESAKAKDYATKAADFNSLPALPYAFVRTKAKQLVGKKV